MSREKHIPVGPFEGDLAYVIDVGLFHQRDRAHIRQWEASFQRFHVIVEVDEQRFVVTGLDEAVRVAVEAR